MIKRRDAYIPTADGEQLFTARFTQSARPQTKYHSPIKSGPTIVLVHGLGGDTEAYVPLIHELLKAGIGQCITYDLRGYGFSSRTFPTHTDSLYQQYAADLVAICQYFDITRPVLVGQSLGGMVIQEALQQPTLRQHLQPQAVVLVSSNITMPNLSVVPSFWFKLLQRYSQHREPLTTKRTLADHVRFKNSWDYSPARLKNDIQACGVVQYLLLWLSAFGWHNQQPSTLNQQPLLYIYGEKDQVMWKSHQEKTVRQLPKCHSVVINTNHNAIVNEPTILAEAIQQFLQLRSR